LIVAQVVYKCLMERGLAVTGETLNHDVNMVMRVGDNKAPQPAPQPAPPVSQQPPAPDDDIPF